MPQALPDNEIIQFRALINKKKASVKALFERLLQFLVSVRHEDSTFLQQWTKNYQKASRWSIDSMQAALELPAIDARRVIGAQEATIDMLLKTFDPAKFGRRSSSMLTPDHEIPGLDYQWDDFMKRAEVFNAQREGFMLRTKLGTVEKLEFGGGDESFGEEDGCGKMESDRGQASGAGNEESAVAGGMHPEDPLIHVFTPEVPMTQIWARNRSIYLQADCHKNLKIQDAAYASQTPSGPDVPCRPVLNEEYQGPVEARRYKPLLRYVGFIFPDQTSLSYIPVRGVTLLASSFNPVNASEMGGSGRIFMRIRVNRALYMSILEMVIGSYREINATAEILPPWEHGGKEPNIEVDVAVRGDRKLKIVGNSYTEYVPVVEAIYHCGHDITGDCQLQWRFNSTYRGRNSFQLRCVLFGLMVTRDDDNWDDPVFRVASRMQRGRKQSNAFASGGTKKT